MSSPAIFYVDSDRLPDLSFTFEGVDLSVYSSITLRIRREDGVLVESTAVIDNAGAGEGHFEFEVGAIVEGNHEAEILTVRASDAKEETFPDDKSLPFIVRERV